MLIGDAKRDKYRTDDGPDRNYAQGLILVSGHAPTKKSALQILAVSIWSLPLKSLTSTQNLP